MFFFADKTTNVYDNGQGVVRTVLGYDGHMMIVRNDFETGAIGTLHSHPHEQTTYVQSGRFLFTIDGEEHEVKAGDALHKNPNVVHGCKCLEAGTLIDIFTPIREDFLPEQQ